MQNTRNGCLLDIAWLANAAGRGDGTEELFLGYEATEALVIASWLKAAPPVTGRGASYLLEVEQGSDALPGRFDAGSVWSNLDHTRRGQSGTLEVCRGDWGRNNYLFVCQRTQYVAQAGQCQGGSPEEGVGEVHVWTDTSEADLGLNLWTQDMGLGDKLVLILL